MIPVVEPPIRQNADHGRELSPAESTGVQVHGKECAMPTDMQEIADKLEIQELLIRYAYALDNRLWDEWDRTFTSDAIIDFSHVGMKLHSPAEVRQISSAGDPKRLSSQHLTANVVIKIESDSAAAYSEAAVNIVMRSEQEGKAWLQRSGAYYQDQLVRTPDGWRIKVRVCYVKWRESTEIAWPEGD
jgi:3-phenylpropionate/cinnamic acid dioxygenase small subunit